MPGQTRGAGEASGAGRVAFNGGPGNCPAKPEPHKERLAVQVDPSMEGRAIARPNFVPKARNGGYSDAAFNGGPGNCPAKPCSLPTRTTTFTTLQWRAGQLPGQTIGAKQGVTVGGDLQWRAGQLPGQTG